MDQSSQSPFEDNRLPILNKQFTRRDMLKGVVVGGATLSLGSLLASCGSSEPSETASPSNGAGTPKNGGHLRVAMQQLGEADTLDPHLAGRTESDEALNFNCFDGLTGFDQNSAVVMMLAEELIANSEATQYTARLKKDLTFHNGKPVTADDVVFSFERMMNPKDPKSMTSVLKNVQRVQKMDDLTVRFHLAAPNSVFPENLAHYACAILPVGFKVTGEAKELIGTGVWKVLSFKKGQQVELVPNTEYYGAKAYLDKVTWFGIPDPTAQLNAVFGGTADYATGIASAQVPLVKKTPGFAVHESKSGSYSPFVMRVDLKPFTDVRVRKAFKLIADRNQMVDLASSGFSWIGNDMQAPYDAGYPKDVPQRTQDLEQARSLLKQAGFDNDLKIQLDTSDGLNPDAVAAATVFAEQAKQAGVTVKVNKIDGSQFFGDEWLSYPFAMDQWATRGYLNNAAFQTMPGAPWNETHWEHPEWAKIVDEAYATVDETKRKELVGEALKIEHEESGYIIWSFQTLLDAHSEKVAGMVPDVFMSTACRWRWETMYFV